MDGWLKELLIKRGSYLETENIPDLVKEMTEIFKNKSKLQYFMESSTNLAEQFDKNRLVKELVDIVEANA